ncbi:hypothetical protein [Paraburkholderia sp. C35]|uniref:hypothetical protein n=1 Tax=Paraburkholderia sp. C35 TaxID=2126993 RepID=UPI000D686413|nr:hypothetical protein [Paraburkholderia sp. C35]
MASHSRSRQRHDPAPTRTLHFGLTSRVLPRVLLAAALVSALALMPHAHAQNNPAQGNGQNAGANKDNGNGNDAPVRKSAAQRSQEDAQRLLGGPSTAAGAYDMSGATPDTQRDALLNSERMRVAKPNTQAMGGPTAGGADGAAPAAGGAIRRPARAGAAGAGAGAGNVAGGGAGVQRAAAVNDVNAGGGAVYGNPYSERAGKDIYKSPW